MLENSYDASGIKFGIVCLPDLREYCLEDIIKLISDSFKNEEVYIIDFEAIDGLTANEISPTLQSKDEKILICAYSRIEYEDIYGKRKLDSTIYQYYVVSKAINSDVPIDVVLESMMLGKYSTADDIFRKCARCFLERYRYGTKEKVDEQIQKIMRK